ncbi:ArnT family glycosyltransferase [Flavilitoribacter nigricans]|uniref:Glycosyltransferase RgtA/B/C/D-like domain-containing protein n=1 Tax=Flavilitoribacter nigricans (strain ATCC 23147 / DSM 23189 / NBRC 102662 / NCIMB 1420 / SS-2) TaxID=1122177 RepID=A0A2D0MZV8_FLAN2|nr:glycosyltransferase family 39 protein [Flavilitoribacter nigricans]PHN01710.1 hypothetical protein CRP01_35780 [Flavilitoribacter nigricans DSM 23189 = NBRC 102662]
MHKRDWIWFGLAWLTCIVLVNPIGAFPLNDDWGYALVVKHLVETGEYRPGTWPVMTLFTQVCWGAAFAWLFGFSFSILRISTLVLAISGSYWIFRECLRLGSSRYWAWIVLAGLALNPLYFHLSFSFMTDVPFTVAIIGAILLYRRALETDRIGYWLAAGLATIAATLIRQPALLLAPAFGLAAVLRRPDWRSLIRTILLVGLTYGALLWYVHFVGLEGETPGAPGSLQPLLRRLRFPLFWTLLTHRGGMILWYVSVFLFPPILLRSISLIADFRTTRKWVPLGAALVTILLLAIFSWQEIPVGNIVEFFGLGPTAMVGRDTRYMDAPVVYSAIWPLFQLAGYGIMALLLWLAYDRLQQFSNWPKWPDRTFWKLGLVFFILAYSLYLLLDKYHFDRYQLVILPALLLLLTPGRPQTYPRWARVAILVFLIAMGLFSVGATRDNLAWNRVRWTVLQSMIQEEGIPADQINGGMEFNGWYATAPQNPFSFDHKSWWFVAEDQYVLSFSRDLPCTIRNRAYPVRSWWPGPDTLYVHERAPVVRRDTIFSDLEQVVSDSNYLQSNFPEFPLAGVENRVTDRRHSGQHAFFLTPQNPYAGKIRLQPVQACEAITITAWRLGNDRSAGIVASAPNPDDFHTFQNIFTENARADGWHRLRHEIRLPEDYPSDQLDIYLWNPVIDSIWMDDVRVIWRRVQ